MSIQGRPAPLLIGRIALPTAGIAVTGCAAMPASAGGASTAATTTGDAGSAVSPAEQANETLVTQLITEAFAGPDSPDAAAAAQAAVAPDAVAHGAGLTAGPTGCSHSSAPTTHGCREHRPSSSTRLPTAISRRCTGRSPRIPTTSERARPPSICSA